MKQISTEALAVLSECACSQQADGGLVTIHSGHSRARYIAAPSYVTH